MVMFALAEKKNMVSHGQNLRRLLFSVETKIFTSDRYMKVKESG